MTFGSLFAGIGGMDLGLERAGMVCRWQVEIDPFCRRVLEKHWPNVRRYEDVRTVGAADLERVDLIAGGFPCQDISEAGKRVGIGGERSGLWSEMVRIYREVGAFYLLVENVPALTRRGLSTVLWDLADCGCDAEWDVLGPGHLGASQHRERIWILAYPHDAGLQGPIWAGQPYPPVAAGMAGCMWRTFAINWWILAARTSCGHQHSANG